MWPAAHRTRRWSPSAAAPHPAPSDEACSPRRRSWRSRQAQQGQVVLDGDDGGPDQCQRLRRGHQRSSGEVDRADERAGTGVMDRYRRTAPCLHDPGEVLRSADLELAVQGQRGARGVGPGALSLQSAPGTKFMASARPQALRSPSTQSRVPSAALTATTTPESAASSTSRRRMTGSAGQRVLLPQLATPQATDDGCAPPWSGSTPLARLRCQLSATTRRSGVESR